MNDPYNTYPTHPTHPTPLHRFAERLQHLMESVLPDPRNGPAAATVAAALIDDTTFNQWALELYQLQRAHNPVYETYGSSLPADVQNPSHWSLIPALPAVAFKELDVSAIAPAQRSHVFCSSRTTGQQPSRHHHHAASLALYTTSLNTWFRQQLGSAMTPGTRMLFLTPPPEQAPSSSLIHMLAALRDHWNPPITAFTGRVNPSSETWDLDPHQTQLQLDQALRDNQPVALMGTAFNCVHLLDHLDAEHTTMRLPEGSFILETGGYKGRSRSLPRAELHSQLSRALGVPTTRIHTEYGMSELCSQGYALGSVDARDVARFHFPPWTRVQIVSPETNQPVGPGETGLIRVIDLANVWSVMTLQTEDLGQSGPEGLVLLGRAAMAEPRGCSLQAS